MQTHVELSEIEIYNIINGEKVQILKNKDTIAELANRGMIQRERLIPSEYLDPIYSYWNCGGKASTINPLRECLYVKLRHPNAIS